MQSGVGGLQALFLFLFLFERQREEDWSTDNSICWFAVQEPARALNHELGMPRVWMDGPQLDGPLASPGLAFAGTWKSGAGAGNPESPRSAWLPVTPGRRAGAGAFTEQSAGDTWRRQLGQSAGHRRWTEGIVGIGPSTSTGWLSRPGIGGEKGRFRRFYSE